MHRRQGRLVAWVVLGAATFASSVAIGWPAPQQQAAIAAREDLARDKSALASTFQSDDKSPAAAFDGEPESRWCASDSSAPSGSRLTSAGPRPSLDIGWSGSHAEVVHPFTGSRVRADGKTWSNLVAISTTDEVSGSLIHFPGRDQGDPLRPLDRDRDRARSLGKPLHL